MKNMIDRVINKHLRSDELDLPFRRRLSRWHWERVAHSATPVFWCLAHVWWIPGFRWLYQLRCRNVEWRMKRYTQRRIAKGPKAYNWSRV